jgi:hypothetical protein
MQSDKSESIAQNRTLSDMKMCSGAGRTVYCPVSGVSRWAMRCML